MFTNRYYILILLLLYSFISFRQNHYIKSINNNYCEHCFNAPSSTSMVLHTTNLRPDYRRNLLAAIEYLNKSLHASIWEVAEEGRNGLYRVLGFKEFEEYWQFMLACDFVANKCRGNTCRKFFTKLFQSASNNYYVFNTGGTNH